MKIIFYILIITQLFSCKQRKQYEYIRTFQKDSSVLIPMKNTEVKLKFETFQLSEIIQMQDQFNYGTIFAKINDTVVTNNNGNLNVLAQIQKDGLLSVMAKQHDTVFTIKNNFTERIVYIDNESKSKFWDWKLKAIIFLTIILIILIITKR